jgi:hypothetical protein
VNGLANSKPYLFAVRATNATGAGPISIDSNVLRPHIATTVVVSSRPQLSINGVNVAQEGLKLTTAINVSCAIDACIGGVRLMRALTTTSTIRVHLHRGFQDRTVKTKTFTMLGRAHYRLVPGQASTLELILTPAGRRALEAASTARPLQAMITASVHQGSATSIAVTVN